MNGSSLLVDQYSTLKVNGLVCYENFDYYTDCKWPGQRHKNLNDAVIQNNGVIKVADSVGTIKSTKADSIFALSNSSSFTMYEPKDSNTDPIQWFEKQMTLSMPSETGEILTGVGKYTSVGKNSNYFWQKSEYIPDEITITIDSKDGFATGEEQEKTFALLPKFSPSYYGYDKFVYNWTVSSGAYFKDTGTTSSNLYNPEFYLPKNSGNSDIAYTVNLNVKFSDASDAANTTINEIKPAIFTAKKSCILPTALVLMADGSYKRAGLIHTGDMVMSFNHETGKIEARPILFNFIYEEKLVTVTELHFEDESISISGDHGFFDFDLNRYVYLNNENVREYVGHRFPSRKDNAIQSKVLTGYSLRKEITKLYCPVTVFHLDYFVGTLLSMPGGIEGCFNIFEYGENRKYDVEKKEADISRYGLLSYSEVKEYIPEIIFNSLPRKYRKVAIGKGMLTKEKLEYYRIHFYSLRKK